MQYLSQVKNVTRKNAKIRTPSDKKGKGESELDKFLQPEQNSCQGKKTGLSRPFEATVQADGKKLSGHRKMYLQQCWKRSKLEGV